MRIPSREGDRRRLGLSAIACSLVSLPFALAGLRTALVIPAAWVAGWIEYHFWRKRRERRRAAAETGLDAGTADALPGASQLYAGLDPAGAAEFRSLAAIFLSEHPVTGVAGALVSDRTRALVASAAVTLLWGRPEWEYPGFGEVLVYPSGFSDDGSFRLVRSGTEHKVLGMAHGLGAVILSLPHLEGSPGPGLALHEFAHVLDGVRCADGVPSQLSKRERDEWLKVMGVEIRVDLPGYEGLPRPMVERPSEFFAEAVEIFFTRPGLMSSRRPALYDALRAVFRQDPFACLKSRESTGESPACTEGIPPPASSLQPP